MPLMCQAWDQLQIGAKENTAKKLRVGAFLTEFGALSNTQKSAG